jgi:hypothetical protein
MLAVCVLDTKVSLIHLGDAYSQEKLQTFSKSFTAIPEKLSKATAM